MEKEVRHTAYGLGLPLGLSRPCLRAKGVNKRLPYPHVSIENHRLATSIGLVCILTLSRQSLQGEAIPALLFSGSSL
jgi:hypothetical protein